MKLVTCRKCGEGHQCEGTLSSAERSAKAIGTRWSKAREGSELAKKAVRLRAEKPRVAPIVQPEIARAPRVPSDEPTKRVRPSDMCPHGREYKFCSILSCKAEVA